MIAILTDSSTSSQWISVPHDSPDILYTGEWKAWLVTITVSKSDEAGKSKKMLSESNLSISRIASDLGYNDTFYFSKYFKASENMTPLQYRKLYKELNSP